MSAMPFTDFRPTMVMADSSPLIHLAAVGQLDLLFEYGQSYSRTSYVSRLRSIRASRSPRRSRTGSRQTADPVFRLSLPISALSMSSRSRPGCGRRAIPESEPVSTGSSTTSGGPALIIYENGRIPNMLRREGLPEDVVVMVSR